ncbi:hypothetical protein [Glaciecola sp. 33A]|jgi:3'-5' exoribonuclease|uniref:hypothetical protein n=1 Tax=Glaciecola sp. 33A TaxID=2057807 RepID=UPI000CBB8B17|nr:hypothetical protein [Glaciecola sp. 33A]PKI02504.1 hypothetical protein CXF81_06080 [Glaciecola sp. 33A]
MRNQISLSHQPLLMYASSFTRFKGTYYLVGCSDRLDSQQNQVKILLISDASCTLTLYCRDQSCILEDLKPESLVDIEVALDMSGSEPYFRCKMIQNADKGINMVRNIYQLPVARCPYPDVLHAMIGLIEQIKTTELREFLDNVISQPDIGIRFVQCPASLNHHHNNLGGLLEHSYEVALSFYLDKSLSHADRDIGIVSALLHDIGKTLTLTPDLTRADLGYSVDHDDLTLEICSAALKILSSKHKGLANQLRHNWTCVSPTAKYGFRAKTKTAKMLKVYDRGSALLQTNNLN